MFNLATFFQTLSTSETLKYPGLREDLIAPKQDAYLQRAFNRETDGIVTEAIVPGQIGQIEYRGGWWSAQSQSPLVLPIGTIVCVVSVPAIPLEVEPLYFPFQN